MTRPPAGETRARIQAAAVDLFMARGVDKTSLREIADRLGITKAALYYHFPSKESLVRSLVDPFLADVEALLAEAEAGPAMPPRQFLESYFDLFIRHRQMFQLMVRDFASFGQLGLEQKVIGWQVRMRHLLVGRDASPADQVRAVVALGGLQDCAALLPDVSAEQARPVAIEAACAALGLHVE